MSINQQQLLQAPLEQQAAQGGKQGLQNFLNQQVQQQPVGNQALNATQPVNQNLQLINPSQLGASNANSPVLSFTPGATQQGMTQGGTQGGSQGGSQQQSAPITHGGTTQGSNGGGVSTGQGTDGGGVSTGGGILKGGSGGNTISDHETFNQVYNTPAQTPGPIYQNTGTATNNGFVNQTRPTTPTPGSQQVAAVVGGNQATTTTPTPNDTVAQAYQPPVQESQNSPAAGIVLDPTAGAQQVAALAGTQAQGTTLPTNQQANLINNLVSNRTGRYTPTLNIGNLISDENLKTNISSGDRDVSDFMSKIGAHNYTYKDSAHNSPSHKQGQVYTSLMAQELEQTKLGKQAVIETPQGKMVDYARLGGVNLAAVSVIHKEQEKLKRQVQALSDQLRKRK